MKTSLDIYEGKVARDIYGSWEDCDPGLYLGGDMITTIFSQYRGRTIRVTIEEIPEED